MAGRGCRDHTIAAGRVSRRRRQLGEGRRSRGRRGRHRRRSPLDDHQEVGERIPPLYRDDAAANWPRPTFRAVALAAVTGDEVKTHLAAMSGDGHLWHTVGPRAMAGSAGRGDHRRRQARRQSESHLAARPLHFRRRPRRCAFRERTSERGGRSSWRRSGTATTTPSSESHGGARSSSALLPQPLPYPPATNLTAGCPCAGKTMTNSGRISTWRARQSPALSAGD